MIEAKPSMTFHSLKSGSLPTSVSISCFHAESGVEEYHIIVRPIEYGGIATQLRWISCAYQEALRSATLDFGTCVFRRFFCSDLVNQASALETHRFANPNDQDEPCAVSLVCQAPVPPAKVALWAYHIKDPRGVLKKGREGAALSLERGDLTHLWSTGITCSDTDASYTQTQGIFARYERDLELRQMRLSDHVIRTWFFVQNIDANYQGLVDARREIFAEKGLTPDTHFIASTGIEGTSADVTAKVMMDAYAIAGIRPEQIQFLSAPDHLSPTHTYGVTFERGVSVEYRDCKHILISGTASIDKAGEIVHRCELTQQLDRTIENVQALLHNAGAVLQDVCMFIVYLRDPSDLHTAEQIMADRFGPAPFVVVHAPVCRPGWLVEIECQAITSNANPLLPNF